MKKPLHPDDRSFIALRGSLSAAVTAIDFSPHAVSGNKVMPGYGIAVPSPVVAVADADVNRILIPQ
jgi:hypothetical protein